MSLCQSVCVVLSVRENKREPVSVYVCEHVFMCMCVVLCVTLYDRCEPTVPSRSCFPRLPWLPCQSATFPFRAEEALFSTFLSFTHSLIHTHVLSLFKSRRHQLATNSAGTLSLYFPQSSMKQTSAVWCGPVPRRPCVCVCVSMSMSVSVCLWWALKCQQVVNGL